MPNKKTVQTPLAARISMFLAGLTGYKPEGTSKSERDAMKMNELPQEQTATEGSTAIQGGRDVVIYNGISYADARQIAIDVYRGSLAELTVHARAVAQERAEQVTDEILEKLLTENAEGIGQAKEPGFQFALATVQKEYARAGDKDLADLLVDLLVDRTKHPSRDIKQIVLDESINTAPKLTAGQLATLSVIFALRSMKQDGVSSHEALGAYLDSFVQPFHAELVRSDASFQHLQFAGCGAVQVTNSTVETLLGSAYHGLFVKGFEASDVEKHGLKIGQYPNLFLGCLNDASKMQVAALNVGVLKQKMASDSVSEKDAQRMTNLFNLNKMSGDEIKAKCIQIRPYMEGVIDAWNSSNMKSFVPTSVGIAIAHANIKRIRGEFADLSIWIN